MKIFLNILFLIIGFVSLIFGANYFVEGATAVAKKLKVPTIIIGLTVVAIGTSLPELAVSVTSAINGSADLSVGNVVGSNLSNMLLILGIVAIITPVTIQKGSKHFDLPFMMISTGLLLFFAADNQLFNKPSLIARWEAIILFVFFIAYMVIQILMARNKNEYKDVKVKTSPDEPRPQSRKRMKTWKVILFLVGGLAGVVFGGECVSRTSKFLAMAAGMSEALVGVTIVALGTSLPELVTSVVAAKKGQTDLAVGNVVGSNIMNIVLIIGLAGIIAPIGISGIMVTDMLILAVTSIVFSIICYTENRINRMEGIMLVILYFGYMAFAIVRNYA